jgi:hypothetical protein
MVTPMNVADCAEFDRGYWKVDRFIDLTLNGIKFITPLKEGFYYQVLTRKGGKKGKNGRI